MRPRKEGPGLLWLGLAVLFAPLWLALFNAFVMILCMGVAYGGKEVLQVLAAAS